MAEIWISIWIVYILLILIHSVISYQDVPEDFRILLLNLQVCDDNIKETTLWNPEETDHSNSPTYVNDALYWICLEETDHSNSCNLIATFDLLTEEF